MTRLLPGADDKIDRINDAVLNVKSEDKNKQDKGTAVLLEMFYPLLLALICKWAKYFQDPTHKLISIDDLLVDAQFWMWKYTKNKYVVNGPATYNTFIKSHMDQRIRYIYETELKRSSKIIHPAPNKFDAEDDGNTAFDRVLSKYCRINYQADTVEETVISEERQRGIDRLHARTLQILDDEQYVVQRHAEIFKLCVLEGRTHASVGKELGISRVRVSQMVQKAKERIREAIIKEELLWWEVLD